MVSESGQGARLCPARTVVVDDTGIVEDVEEVGRQLLLAHRLEEALHGRVVAKVAMLRACEIEGEPTRVTLDKVVGTRRYLVLEAKVGRVQVNDERRRCSAVTLEDLAREARHVVGRAGRHDARAGSTVEEMARGSGLEQRRGLAVGWVLEVNYRLLLQSS